MRSLVLALLALVLVPGGASAKGVSAVKLCGADGCERVSGSGLDALAYGSPEVAPRPEPEPFFRAKLITAHDGEVLGHFELIVAPKSGRLMADDGTWTPMGPETMGAYAKLTRGREPFPADQMPAGRGRSEPAARVDAVYEAPPRDEHSFPWWALLLPAPLVALALRSRSRTRSG